MSTSLANLLAGYSAEIDARVAHNTEQEQENVDRKAVTIEDHFQHAKDSVESLGGEVAAAGAAMHLGRKVYKKYQEKYGKKKAEQPDSNENTGQENTDKPTPEEGGSGENEGADSGAGQGGGTDAQSGADAGNVDANSVSNDAADNAADDARTGDPSGNDPAAGDSGSAGTTTAADEGADAAADAGQAAAVDVNPFSPSQFGVTGEDFAASGGEATTTVGQEIGGAARTTTGEFGGAGTGGEEFGDTGSDALGQVVRVRPTQIVQNTPQAQAAQSGTAPEQPVSQAAAPTDAPAPPTAANVTPPSGAAADADDAADAAEQLARTGGSTISKLTGGASDAINSAGKVVGNIGKQLGSKLGVTAGEEAGSEAGGLITTEGVLDALGPVGEIGGAIVGLIGLFEGLFHKPKPVSDTMSADSPVETQVGGIDPTALAQKNQAVGTVV
jgi:hypothetical protein